VLFDPDNGIGGEQGQSAKHIYLSDMRRYWKRGQSLLIYHHLPMDRLANDAIKEMTELLSGLQNSRIVTYHFRRSEGRVYFFCLQPGHFNRIPDPSKVKMLEPLLMTKVKWAALRRRAQQACHEEHSWYQDVSAAPSETNRLEMRYFMKESTSNENTNRTTNVGYVNNNGQVVIRNTGRPGNLHGQTVYQLGCSHCGHVYGANGADIHLRNCPEHQGGAPGLPYE
jgi:hypothetical protein